MESPHKKRKSVQPPKTTSTPASSLKPLVETPNVSGIIFPKPKDRLVKRGPLTALFESSDDTSDERRMSPYVDSESSFELAKEDSSASGGSPSVPKAKRMLDLSNISLDTLPEDTELDSLDYDEFLRSVRRNDFKGLIWNRYKPIKEQSLYAKVMDNVKALDSLAETAVKKSCETPSAGICVIYQFFFECVGYQEIEVNKYLSDSSKKEDFIKLIKKLEDVELNLKVNPEKFLFMEKTRLAKIMQSAIYNFLQKFIVHLCHCSQQDMQMICLPLFRLLTIVCNEANMKNIVFTACVFAMKIISGLCIAKETVSPDLFSLINDYISVLFIASKKVCLIADKGLVSLKTIYLRELRLWLTKCSKMFLDDLKCTDLVRQLMVDNINTVRKISLEFCIKLINDDVLRSYLKPDQTKPLIVQIWARISDVDLNVQLKAFETMHVCLVKKLSGTADIKHTNELTSHIHHENQKIGSAAGLCLIQILADEAGFDTRRILGDLCEIAQNFYPELKALMVESCYMHTPLLTDWKKIIGIICSNTETDDDNYPVEIRNVLSELLLESVIITLTGVCSKKRLARLVVKTHPQNHELIADEIYSNMSTLLSMYSKNDVILKNIFKIITMLEVGHVNKVHYKVIKEGITNFPEIPSIMNDTKTMEAALNYILSLYEKMPPFKEECEKLIAKFKKHVTNCLMRAFEKCTDEDVMAKTAEQAATVFRIFDANRYLDWKDVFPMIRSGTEKSIEWILECLHWILHWKVKELSAELLNTGSRFPQAREYIETIKDMYAELVSACRDLMRVHDRSVRFVAFERICDTTLALQEVEKDANQMRKLDIVKPDLKGDTVFLDAFKKVFESCADPIPKGNKVRFYKFINRVFHLCRTNVIPMSILTIALKYYDVYFEQYSSQIQPVLILLKEGAPIELAQLIVQTIEMLYQDVKRKHGVVAFTTDEARFIFHLTKRFRDFDKIMHPKLALQILAMIIAYAWNTREYDILPFANVFTDLAQERAKDRTEILRLINKNVPPADKKNDSLLLFIRCIKNPGERLALTQALSAPTPAVDVQKTKKSKNTNTRRQPKEKTNKKDKISPKDKQKVAKTQLEVEVPMEVDQDVSGPPDSGERRRQQSEQLRRPASMEVEVKSSNGSKSSKTSTTLTVQEAMDEASSEDLSIVESAEENYDFRKNTLKLRKVTRKSDDDSSVIVSQDEDSEQEKEVATLRKKPSEVIEDSSTSVSSGHASQEIDNSSASSHSEVDKNQRLARGVTPMRTFSDSSSSSSQQNTGQTSRLVRKVKARVTPMKKQTSEESSSQSSGDINTLVHKQTLDPKLSILDEWSRLKSRNPMKSDLKDVERKISAIKLGTITVHEEAMDVAPSEDDLPIIETLDDVNYDFKKTKTSKMTNTSDDDDLLIESQDESSDQEKKINEPSKQSNAPMEKPSKEIMDLEEDFSQTTTQSSDTWSTLARLKSIKKDIERKISKMKLAPIIEPMDSEDGLSQATEWSKTNDPPTEIPDSEDSDLSQTSESSRLAQKSKSGSVTPLKQLCSEKVFGKAPTEENLSDMSQTTEPKSKLAWKLKAGSVTPLKDQRSENDSEENLSDMSQTTESTEPKSKLARKLKSGSVTPLKNQRSEKEQDSEENLSDMSQTNESTEPISSLARKLKSGSVTPLKNQRLEKEQDSEENLSDMSQTTESTEPQSKLARKLKAGSVTPLKNQRSEKEQDSEENLSDMSQTNESTEPMSSLARKLKAGSVTPLKDQRSENDSEENLSDMSQTTESTEPKSKLARKLKSGSVTPLKNQLSEKEQDSEENLSDMSQTTESTEPKSKLARKLKSSSVTPLRNQRSEKEPDSEENLSDMSQTTESTEPMSSLARKLKSGSVTPLKVQKNRSVKFPSRRDASEESSSQSSQTSDVQSAMSTKDQMDSDGSSDLSQISKSTQKSYSSHPSELMDLSDSTEPKSRLAQKLKRGSVTPMRRLDESELAQKLTPLRKLSEKEDDGGSSDEEAPFEVKMTHGTRIETPDNMSVISSSSGASGTSRVSTKSGFPNWSEFSHPSEEKRESSDSSMISTVSSLSLHSKRGKKCADESTSDDSD